VRYLRMGLIVAAAWMALPAAAANAFVTRAPSGHRMSLMPRAGTRTSSKGGSTGSVLLAHGGPALAAEAPYLIFWAPPGHAISSSSQALLDRYLGDVAAVSGTSTTNVFSVLAQYGAPYQQTFSAPAQALVDGNPYPAKQSGCGLAAGMTACVTDAALQGEIARLIDAGRLPEPGAPGTGSTPVFLVITPVDVNVCISGGSCVNNSFCAYHDWFTHNGSDVVYASVPFSVFAGDPKGCQTDGNSVYETPVGSGGDEAYNVADDLSHELSEMITDPLINAWYSKNGLEVADLCEAYAATANTNKGLSPLAYAPAFGNASAGVLYDQLINGDQYYNQTEFSNAAGKCLAGATALPA
jgi:hypothetical protein